MNDIERRIQVLEKAVGIDLDTSSVCTGNPASCPASPCREDRCPLRNNLVSRANHAVALHEAEMAILRFMMDILVRHSRFPPGLVDLAKLQAERKALSIRIAFMKETLDSVGDSTALRESFKALSSELETELARVSSELEEKERFFNATSDQGEDQRPGNGS